MASDFSELQSFNSRLVKVGSATLIAGIIANFIPVTYIYLKYGIIPPLGTIAKIWALVAATFGVSWVVQPISFFPLLGTSGSYIAWLAGSVADIRTPASTMAQKSAGVEAGSLEGDIISTLGISTSVFVSASLLTIGTFVGVKLVPLLPTFVTESFKYILPAVFAAVYTDLSEKDVLRGFLVFVACVAVAYIGPILHFSGAWLYLGAVVAGMVIAGLLVKQRTSKES